MTEKVASQVQFQIEQIDHLFESYAGLLEKGGRDRPDLIEVTALASVLHSFYNGLENIFMSIAKGIDSHVPTSANWHRDLLTQMTESNLKRGPVLKVETGH